MKKVWSIWTEDEGDWGKAHWPAMVWSSKKAAEEYLKQHLKLQNHEDWLEDGLAYVYELTVQG